MFGQCAAHRSGTALPKLGAAFDVGEEKGYNAAGKSVAHDTVIRLVRYAKPPAARLLERPLG